MSFWCHRYQEKCFENVYQTNEANEANEAKARTLLPLDILLKVLLPAVVESCHVEATNMLFKPHSWPATMYVSLKKKRRGKRKVWWTRSTSINYVKRKTLDSNRKLSESSMAPRNMKWIGGFSANKYRSGDPQGDEDHKESWAMRIKKHMSHIQLEQRVVNIREEKKCQPKKKAWNPGSEFGKFTKDCWCSGSYAAVKLDEGKNHKSEWVFLLRVFNLYCSNLL